VWEHAYMVDYGASGRGDYIKAFFSNVNWPIVEQRFNDASAGRLPKRL
jgi:Fe-Mn family superoxide dismutase